MAKPKKQKELRPLGLGKILLLAVFCFLVAESIACYIFAPDLFHRIADPIAEKTVALAKLGKEKAIAFASKTQETITAWAEQAEKAAQAFKESLEPKPDLPTPAAGNTKQTSQPQSDLVIQHDGYYTNPVTGDTVLTGGNVDILFFEQSAPAWKDKLYGSDPIGTHGCGPTAMAMVISSLTDYRVDPTTVANWSVQNGYHPAAAGCLPRTDPCGSTCLWADSHLCDRPHSCWTYQAAASWKYPCDSGASGAFYNLRAFYDCTRCLS